MGHSAYDAGFRSEMSDHDPARAKALLDMFGYVDKDGDGWRDQPDGSPLVLDSLTTPDGVTRQIDEIWQKSLAKVGLRVSFKPGKWPENYKALRAGKFQIWSLATSASMPRGPASQSAPCRRASTSSTSKPMLCRVPAYLRPGLPSPATSFIQSIDRPIVDRPMGATSPLPSRSCPS